MKVWDCKIVVADNAVLPEGFDSPPRMAAMAAVERSVHVISCFSGWGGKLSDIEAEIVGKDVLRDMQKEDG